MPWVQGEEGMGEDSQVGGLPDEGDLRTENMRLLLPGCFQPGGKGDEDCWGQKDSQKEQLLGDPLQKS